MSKFIPVDPDKWAEMVKALSEVTRLKAENERLTKAHSDALADFWGIHKGYFDLKAEVERLTAFTTRTIIPNEELQAQVERLTKAGDAMAKHLDYGDFPISLKAWNAAKEGKQP